MFLDFIRYYLCAKNEHAIHSPFVFEFYNKVLKDKSLYHEFSLIEAERHKLLADRRTLKKEDFGAGSKKSNPQKISTQARTSLKSRKWGKFLFRVARFYNYKTIVDLGTSFGITTAYLAKSNVLANIYTFEGCLETLKVAKTTFENLDIYNVECIGGNIDLTLNSLIKSLDQIDLAFFDANHREEPTLRYFEECLKLKTESSCFVFDDIYWSEEMKNAWKTIKNHPEVTISIDLFFVGLVFFKKGIKKQHFILK
jgi:predicted O-methyltransferase YrrM